jgi:isopenicillin N synthase-like dioxygenase
MHLFERAAVADADAVINKIPVIDYGAYFAGVTGARQALASQVKAACEEVGFFYIKGHGVAQHIVDACFEASKTFHALPLETKLALRQDENNIGYMPMNGSIIASDEIHKTKHPNQNASFFVGHDRGEDHPDVVRKVPLRGRNQWPAGLPQFRVAVTSYFNALQQVAQRMVPVFAEALGLPDDYFDEAFSNEPYIELRLLHSPPQTDVSDERFNVAPHTDNSFITLLARQHEDRPGLAVRLKSGEWFRPPIIDGTLLVNLGNAMRRYSNGRFMSTPHGVINEGATDRYSVAFFYSPNPAALVAPVPTSVSPATPAAFEPVRYGEMVVALHKDNYRRTQPARAANEA